MSENKIQGKVIAIGGSRGGTSKKGNQWKTQEIIVEYGDAQHPKHIKFEFGPDVEKADNALKYLQVGTEAEFYFDIDANEYQGKWYNSIKCWKFDIANKQPQPQPQQPSLVSAPTNVQQTTASIATPNQETLLDSGDSNDLPF